MGMWKGKGGRKQGGQHGREQRAGEAVQQGRQKAQQQMTHTGKEFSADLNWLRLFVLPDCLRGTRYLRLVGGQ